jgi:3-phenylpropionate/trans-cinnamate dioxygenase ferredoxin reductase subunit
MANSTIVVVGTGQAGGWTARTLRDEGHDGRIVLIGEEPFPPYERPPLSKEFLFGDLPVERTYVFPQAVYAEKNIELRLNTRVVGLDAAARTVTLAGEETLAYDKLMLATGSRPRPLPVPGTELAGVYYLRTIADTESIRHAIRPGGAVVVVGGGWIGMEVAAGAKKLGARVTVVEALDRVCARAVTPDLSAFLLAAHQAQGVEVRLNAAVTRIEGHGKAERVVLGDGSAVPASVVVIGIGIVPNVELAAEAGLAVDNGIVVDAYGQTSHPDVYAAGDVTNHPNAILGRRIRLESWENAQNQAIAAAKAMLGKGAPYGEIPWFWSDQFDLNIQLVGLPIVWDRAATRGSPDARQFITFYLKDGRIDGAAAINSARDVRFVRRLMAAGKPVDPDRLVDPAVKLQDLLKG